MGHSVNLLPQAFGTILDCFMSLDFNNMIVRRVWGGGLNIFYFYPFPKHLTVQRLTGGLSALVPGDVNVGPADVNGDKDTVGREIDDALDMTYQKVSHVSQMKRS